MNIPTLCLFTSFLNFCFIKTHYLHYAPASGVNGIVKSKFYYYYCDWMTLSQSKFTSQPLDNLLIHNFVDISTPDIIDILRYCEDIEMTP